MFFAFLKKALWKFLHFRFFLAEYVSLFNISSSIAWIRKSGYLSPIKQKLDEDDSLKGTYLYEKDWPAGLLN